MNNITSIQDAAMTRNPTLRPSGATSSAGSKRLLTLAAGLAVAMFMAACSGDEPVRSEAPREEAGERHDHADHADHMEQGDHDEHDHEHNEHGHDHDHDHEQDEHEAEGGHADEVTLSAEAIARHQVRVERVQSAVLRPTVLAPARISFSLDAMAHVGCPVEGRVVELPVRLGDRVSKNGIVAVVESPELGEAQADYFQRRIAQETAVPAVELARVSWERAAALHQQSQGIALSEVQRREAEYRSAQAALKAAEAAAIGAENRLHLLGMDQAAVEALARSGEITPRYEVRSAIDGQVIDREITLGELVGPIRESLMLLADTSVYWVLADVPEAKLAGIEVGAAAWVTAGVLSERYQGAVAFVSPQVDPATRSAQVRIEIPAEALPLRPGMFARVEIETAIPGAAGAVLFVPDRVIQTVEGEPAVFVPVAGEPRTFAKRRVGIGKAVGGLVPVYEGLAEGEPFVASGSFILKAELGKGSAEHSH